jgi:hypothetical protein
MLKQNLFRNFINIPGWHTNRKIVVIESDDWGSIRMPSKTVFKDLVKRGIHVDKLPYNRYDSLASKDDLLALFDVLTSVKDHIGSNAIFTVNCVVANPDFEKISISDYTEYYYEAFTETLKHYPSHQESFNLWKEGLNKGIFIPQFHGREHLNVIRWMRALRENRGNVRLAFNYRMFDLSESMNISENSFMDALNFENHVELDFQKKVLEDGLNLFEKLFGYKSITFVAPNYIWSNLLNETLFANGIRVIQSGWFQFEPLDGTLHRFKKRFHYVGQRNNFGQFYFVRNAHFEPSLDPSYDWVENVITRIGIAFSWGKPAIISSHRLNYIGFIELANRSRNLILLRNLLNEILKRWPDTEFMSSNQLYHLISSGK